METVWNDLDEQVKDKKTNTLEIFEVAKLPIEIVPNLDNKSILSIESRALSATPGHPSSIGLNANIWKQKRNNLSKKKSIDVATILLRTIKRTIIVLALISASPKRAPTPALALKLGTLLAKPADVTTLEQKITIIEPWFEV